MAAGKIEEILSLLENGDKNFKIGSSRDVVLVFGEANADKSSVTRLMAGDEQNLVSRGLRLGKDWVFQVEESFTRSVETPFLPKLVVDKDGQEFYNCPGLADDANEAEDVSGAYFTRKVIARVESAKLVLVAGYDSIKQPSAIENLLSKASKFVKDLDKFDESIGIVVTRVDAFVPDESIRQSLSSTRQYLASSGKTAEAKLLDVLLSPGKIAVWKKPEAAGHAKDIPSLQEAKTSLQKLVKDELRFTLCTLNDFGIVLSASSQSQLQGLADKINDRIISDVSKVGDQLIEFYQNLENSSTDVDGLNGRFTLDYADKYDAKYSIYWKSATDAKELVRRILEVLQSMDISISKENLLNVLNSDLYLAFVETATGRPVNRRLNWNSGFDKFASYLKNSYQWYTQLSTMQHYLSSYDIQKNTEKMRPVADDLSTTISKNGNFPTSFKKFLQAMGKDQELSKILRLNADERKKKLLKTVVDVSFKNKLTKKCEGKKLSITGQFVRTSDVNNCQDLPEAERKCCESPSEVEVFATHKVFFDEDIDWTGKEIQATIIAPTWEMMGRREFILDGKPGVGPGKKEGAQNARPGSPGKHGKPGEPGGPAGGLVAIGERCVNCGLLYISLEGGRGGAGQDGGDGVKGEDGAKTYNPRTDDGYMSMNKRWDTDGHKACSNKTCNNCDGCYTCTTERYQYTLSEDCTVKGLPGKVGGRGGDGGKGGTGGPKGRVVARFAVEGFPNIYVQNGAQGANGIGGKGGEGGVKAQDMTVRASYQDGYNFGVVEYQDDKPPIKAASGTKGTDGQNTIDTKTPAPLKLINPSLVLNNYKAFVRSNLNQSHQNARNFLEKLGSDPQVLDLYNTMGLVKDMQSLEEQFSSLQNQIEFLPYYTNIQERIDKYIDKLSKTKENDDDHKMVLSYLYSAVLTKLRNINNKFDDGLVVDMKLYLEIVQKEMQKLKRAQEAVEKNKSKQVYLEGLENKVAEANNFINGVIEPEIRSTIRKTDEQIDSLIDEALKLKEEAKKERDKLIVKKHSLEDQMVLRYLLGTVEVASMLLALAGPVGATAGAVIGGVTQVAKGVALTDDDGNYDFKSIPEGVDKSLTAISNHLNSKKESFKKQLEDSKGLLEKLDEEALKNSSIRQVNNKIDSIQSKLKVEMDKANEFDPESIDRMYNMRKELSELLDEQKVQLEQADSKASKAVEYIGKVKKLVEVGKAGKEVYDKIQKSQGAIDKLGDTITKANDQIAKLELQEQSIYKVMMPMVKTMWDSLQKLRDEGASKSHAALDVSRWQIQSSIRDVSKKLKEMTQGYTAQGELTYLMDKVEQGMMTTIQVYDRIQDYQDQASVADYLSQISLTSNTVGNIKDADLKSAVDFLEMNMHFNMVLAEYEKTVDAVKHSVFPLANVFLTSPKTIVSKFDFEHTEKHVENVVNLMTQELDGFIEGLKSMKAKIRKALRGDKIHNNKHYMSALGSVPFYTWKFTGREDIVQRLLDGREIILTADIGDEQVESLKHYAVKFNEIGIDLQLLDRAAQAELNTVLEGFDVNMTHLGHSDYICGDKSYTIHHDSVTLQHSVNKLVTDAAHADYYPGATDSYDTLRVNQPLLSPYTTWKINLVEDRSKSGDFAKLAKFKGQPINLELEGKGQFMDPDKGVCKDLQLDKYYQQIKTSASEDSSEIQQDAILWEMLGKPDGNSKISRSVNEFAENTTVESSFFSSALDSIVQVAKYLSPAQWYTSYQSGQENYSNSLPNSHEPGSDFLATGNSAVDAGLLNFQSNLLLMGLLGPKASKARVRRSAVRTGDAGRSFAHDMAYRAYAPKQ